MLRRHDAVGAAEGLPQHKGDLRDRRLAVGEHELGGVAHHAEGLLLHARQIAWHVDEGDDRYPERVAEPDEAARLDRRVRVDCAR